MPSYLSATRRGCPPSFSAERASRIPPPFLMRPSDMEGIFPTLNVVEIFPSMSFGIGSPFPPCIFSDEITSEAI